MQPLQEPIRRTESSDPAGEPAYIGPAETRRDLVGAFKLLYKNYLEAGYCNRSASEMRVPAFAMLPDTVTFVARRNDHVAATLSLIPDGHFGLPIDEVFRDEVDELRAQGRRLAEAGMLADKRSFSPMRLGFLLDLYKFLIDTCRLSLHVQDICFTVHPHHVLFYERYFLATKMAEPRPFGAVKDNPAVFLRMKLDDFLPERVRTARLRNHFFGAASPVARVAVRHRMSLSDIALFLPSCPGGPGGAGAIRRYLADMVACMRVPEPAAASAAECGGSGQ